MLATNNDYCYRNRFTVSPTNIVTTGNLETYLLRSKFSAKSFAKLKTLPGISSYAEPPSVARMKRLKNRKTNGPTKMDLSKGIPTDYTELAYREAISKLKYLLAESYASSGMAGTRPRSLRSIYKISNPRINESGEDTDDQSVISDGFRKKDHISNTVSNKFIPFSKTIRPTKAYSNIALSRSDLQTIPPELSTFIERQEDYIEQLERESQYCRNELINLLTKVREVVAENEALHNRDETALSKYALQDHKDTDYERHKQDADIHTDDFGKKKSLEGPSIIFESRISELEAQLTQAKLELRKSQEENQMNLKRLSESCPNEDNFGLKTELDKALREKHEVEIQLEEVHKLLLAARDKETEATHKVRRSMDDKQQIEFERNQSETETKRLKEELEKQHEKLRDAAQEANRRILEERQQVERRYNQQIEQLSDEIASHWEVANKFQLESEKQRRELNELKRELSQKQTFTDNLKKELQNKISTLQGDLNQVLNEKDAAEQEILSNKLTAERSERQARQEQNRLQAEINSYKQRLERADADLVHCRRENLRLSGQIASLEKEINMDKVVHLEVNRSQITPKLENEKELTSRIMDMETKHAATVADLEGTLNNQATLVSRLTAECQSLTQRLEDNNLKHKYILSSAQGIIERDVTTVGQTASASNKKRTVKVDLKVKVIPKKKSDSSKTSLSAQNEMTELQNNIKHLSNKIQSTFVSDKAEPTMGINDEASTAFIYDTTMESVAPSHANGLPIIGENNAQALQMIHQEYDTSNQINNEGINRYSNQLEKNNQRQHLYDLSGNQTYTMENNSVPNIMENTEMYPEQRDSRNIEEEYVPNPNMETYMTEQGYEQYSGYDPSQYEEEYDDGQQFNVITEQVEDNQTVSDRTRSDAETSH